MSKVNRSNRKSREEDSSSKKRNNNGKEKHSGTNASTTSGSVTDSSGLRRSVRNSDKGENHPTPTPAKKKPEKVEELPSVRKSDRVDKQITHSTPSKQRPEKGVKQGLPSSDSKKKPDKGEKQAALDTRKQENTEKGERKDVTPTSKASSGLARPKRVLNARNYRAILGNKAKMVNAKVPGPGGASRNRDSVSCRDDDDDGNDDGGEKGLENEISDHGGAGEASDDGGESMDSGDGDTSSDSKVDEGRNGSGGSKRDKKLKPRGKKIEEGGTRPRERHGSSSAKNAKGIKRKREKTEFSNSRKKPKFHSQEARGSKYSHSSPESDPGDTDSQCGSQNAGSIKPTGVKVKRPTKKNFQVLETTDSNSSERRSQTVAADLDMRENIRSADECGTSTRKTPDPVIGASITSGKEVCNLDSSSIDSPSSSSGVERLEVHKRDRSYQCAACFKQKRLDSDQQNPEICSCSMKLSNDLCRISSSKGVRIEAALSKSLQRDEIVINAKENFDQDATAELAETQRQDVHGMPSSHAMAGGIVRSELDRVGLKVNAGTAIAEESGINNKLKESALANVINRDLNTCVVCKLGGKLLCCDGKGCARSYHLSCLDPPLQSVPPGIWHCLRCVKKKLESGVHSVSEGEEAIWDFREIEISADKGNTTKGIQKEKQYYVKFRGLAHVHNRWIPERQLLVEAPMLVTKFNRRYQKEKVTKWKSEWTIPHRLLQKRLLMPLKQADEYFRVHPDIPHCKYEWFVKWKDLGYEHCTWELENEPFLSSLLIKDYESRREKAKKVSEPSRANQLLQERNGPFSNLRRLPDGIPPGMDRDHLRSVNKLRESWHKFQNAVVIDDQERITRVILFILSLQSVISRPFLIISTSTAVSVWESEFMRLAPSIHVVVYSGNRDARRIIRSLEFFEEGGCIMFEVLLSTPDAIVEDFDALECLGWEAIIVDECQRSRMSKHFQQFRMLNSDFRVLLLSDQIKENVVEYLNLLSFLDKEGDGKCVDVSKNDPNGNVDALATLKERLRLHLAYEGKSESSRFIEYWVPVQLSKVQLEQYCTILASNYGSLRSNSAKDEVGALRDVIISARKCCDHPYLVDESLQSLLTKDLPVAQLLNIGVNASGKLQLLDKILQDVKIRGLRVLIIFQLIGGSKPSSIGDILDDYLRQRFGDDSYERVDSGLIASRKQAALSVFNNKERGRFVFLIENRACLPSIKLSSVDIVILFDSDWNPVNDTRALQKITIDSQLEQLKIFRLYSPYTVEEKVLFLAKQGSILESSLLNMSSSISHMLLMWGSTYLFNKLDELRDHDGPSLNSDTSNEHSVSNDAVQEMLNQLLCETETCNTNKCATVVRAQQSGLAYCKTISLVGESEIHLTDEEVPHVFWTKLLEGRFPGWKYSTGLFQRPRRKVQHVEGPSDEGPPVAENDAGNAKKKRKQLLSTVDPISRTICLQYKKNKVGRDKEAKITNTDELPCNSDGPALIPTKKSPVHLGKMTKDAAAAGGGQIDSKSPSLPGSPTPKIDPNCYSRMRPMMNTDPDAARISEGRRTLRDAQHNLHLMLKPQLSELCETLQLSGAVKAMALKFLEYLMNNHKVPREPETILQAFQISLCWMAASFLKQKIDHKSSLSRVKQRFNFLCEEEMVESVYAKLRLLRPFLKNEFSCQTGAASNSSKSSSHEERRRNEEVASHLVPAKPLESTASDQQELEEGEIAVNSQDPNSEEPVFLVQEPESQTLLRKGPQNNISFNKCIVEKIGSGRIKRIIEQQKEFAEFNKLREKEKSDLKKAHRLEREVICSMFSDLLVREQKLKELDEKYDRKRFELERRLDNHQKKLAAMQLDARNKEKLDVINSGRLNKSFTEFPLPESGLRPECLENREQNVVADDSNTKNSRPLLGQRNADLRVLEDLESIESGKVSEGFPAVQQNQSEPITPMEIVIENTTEQSVPLRTETCNIAEEENMPLRTVTVDTQEDMPTEAVMESIAEVNMPIGAEAENTAEDIEPIRTVPDDIAEENMPISENLLVSIGIENTTLERTTVSEAEQHNCEENYTGAISQQQSQIGLSSQSDRYPDQDGSLLSHQVTSDEHNPLETSTEMEREHVPGNEGWSFPQQIEIPSQRMVDPISSQVENFSHSVPFSQPFPQLQLPQHMDVPMEIAPVADPRSSSSQLESSNRPAQNFLLAPQMPHHDPLNNELIRMRKEDDQTIKMHEEEKIRLKTECEKEIEEIRRKYNALLQDAESAFAHRRKLLDMNFNKVLRNKLLADAFKLQLHDPKTGPQASQAGMPSFFLQMLQQPLLLHGQGTAPPPIPAIRPPRGTQANQQSSALFAANLTAARFSAVHPILGNLQAGEPRAPALPVPHTNPSRPTASIPAATTQPVPSGFLGQPFLHRATFPIPPLPRPTLPNYPVAASGTRLPSASLGFSVVPMFPSSSSASALNLLMDFDNRRETNLGENGVPPTTLVNMPPLTESDPSFNVWVPPELQQDSSRIATETVTAATAAAPVDIVCLSDDD